jgi:peptidoglycan biosynthesis protein MviN/MurJ (putative lipid II flippase)
MNDLTLGIIIGVVVQTCFTAAILLRIEYRERRQRREREEVIKMLESAIPTSSTYSSNL